MQIEHILQNAIIAAIKELYQVEVNPAQITLQKTKKEFKGHYTLVTFPLLKISRKNPEQTAEETLQLILDRARPDHGSARETQPL